MRRLRFSADIDAPVSRVFERMLDPDGYRAWTVPFAEGSYYAGTWRQGQKIRFMSPTGCGMVSEIVEHRVNEFTSIRHLGLVDNGVEDTTSEAVRAWAPACESYTFIATPTGTRLVVEQDAAEEWEQYLLDTWPVALLKLKALCEVGDARSQHPPA